MNNHLKNPLFVQNDAVVLGQLPGYGGYMQSIKSENYFGKTFGDTTRAVLQKQVLQGSNLPPNQIYKSMFTQAFTSPHNQEIYNENENQNNIQYENKHLESDLTVEQIRELAYN